MMKNKKMNNNGGGRVQTKGAMEGRDWEMRPGGMLVQKRNLDSSERNSCQFTSVIKVRVKHGSNSHEIQINSHASFGELKNLLAGPTGLHPDYQKLLFKDKERDSKAFLDVVGVQDGSEVVLIQEKRVTELRRNASMEKALRSVLEVTMEIDKLGEQVNAHESVISRGGRVAEKELLNLIEMLMSQLIRLDGITADGDAKLKRKIQVLRVQRYIETLDKLKVQNTISRSHGCSKGPGGGPVAMLQLEKGQRIMRGQTPELKEHKNFTSQQVILTTK